MLVTCTTCSGSRSVKGLGFMTKECPTCFGMGRMEATTEMVKDALASTMPAEKPKRGRPKKVEIVTEKE